MHFWASAGRDLFMCACLHCLHLAEHSHSLLSFDLTKQLACRSFVLFQLGAAHAVTAVNFLTQQDYQDLFSVIEWGRV